MTLGLKDELPAVGEKYISQRISTEKMRVGVCMKKYSGATEYRGWQGLANSRSLSIQ